MEYKQVTFRIPVQVIEQLQDLSKEMNLSKNKLIEIMISDFQGTSKGESVSTSNVDMNTVMSKLNEVIKISDTVKIHTERLDNIDSKIDGLIDKVKKQNDINNDFNMKFRENKF